MQFRNPDNPFNAMSVEFKVAGWNPAHGESFRMRATGGRVLPNDGTLSISVGDGAALEF